MTQRPRLTGTLFASEGYVLYVGPLVATALHAHHAAQVVLAPSGLDVADAEGSSVMSFAAIPPRTRHAHGACEHAAMLFLDGDGAPSRRLERSAARERERWARPALDHRIPRDPSPEAAQRLVAAITRALDLELYPSPRHPAVRRMCRLLAEGERASLAELSRRAGLSSRQMRHAFLRDVGLSMRGYLRWLRLRRSIGAIEAGGSLSAAAIEGGFADGAHLSRVFRSHFGVSPAQALGSVKWCAAPLSHGLDVSGPGPRGR
jgi:AraC-like DNA-binding protein